MCLGIFTLWLNYSTSLLHSEYLSSYMWFSVGYVNWNLTAVGSTVTLLQCDSISSDELNIKKALGFHTEMCTVCSDTSVGDVWGIVLILYCIEVMWPGPQGGHSETSVWIIKPVSVWLGLAWLAHDCQLSAVKTQSRPSTLHQFMWLTVFGVLLCWTE